MFVSLENFSSASSCWSELGICPFGFINATFSVGPVGNKEKHGNGGGGGGGLQSYGTVGMRGLFVFKGLGRLCSVLWVL